jgi:signal transduction histidine kinase
MPEPTDHVLSILIVEDSIADAELCVRALRRSGKEVTFARVDSAEGFKAALGARDWQLVLSDYTMPGFSAIEALRLLRASSLDIPFVVVTGTIDEETAVACLKHGADDYILKSNLARLPSAVVNAIAAYHERHERRKLEEQLRHAQRMETVGTLAGGVAHDFSNLLTAITASAEIIKSKVRGDSQCEEAIRIIETAVEQATGVTRALLTFSHRLPSDKQRIDVRLIVLESAGLLKRVLRKNIVLTIHVDGTPPLWMDADRVQLQQVLLNLAINARDAMPNGGNLTISLRPATMPPRKTQAKNPAGAPAVQKAAQLVISDTGEGMTPEIRERIFEPFFTTKSRDKGTGLGLAIAHGIVEGHHGLIEVESTVGMGTVFTVTLPCLATPDDTGPSKRSLSAKPGRGQTIMLAQQDRYIRELMTSALTSLGFTVRPVNAVDEAAAAYADDRHDIHLLIADVTDLPSGPRQWVTTLRDQGVRAPLILIAGPEPSEPDGPRDEFAFVMRKPLQMADLGKRVAELLTTGGLRPT